MWVFEKVLFYEEIMRQNSQMIFCCLYGKKRKTFWLNKECFTTKAFKCCSNLEI